MPPADETFPSGLLAGHSAHTSARRAHADAVMGVFVPGVEVPGRTGTNPRRRCCERCTEVTQRSIMGGRCHSGSGDRRWRPSGWRSAGHRRSRSSVALHRLNPGGIGAGPVPSGNHRPVPACPEAGWVGARPGPDPGTRRDRCQRPAPPRRPQCAVACEVDAFVPSRTASVTASSAAVVLPPRALSRALFERASDRRKTAHPDPADTFGTPHTPGPSGRLDRRTSTCREERP